MKALVLGGARSGKTRRAMELAAGAAPLRTYVATAEVRDAEMAARVASHRAERDATWRTVEAPLDAAAALADPGRAVLLDCLTLWLTNVLLAEGRRPDTEIARLLAAFSSAPNPVVLVGSEVGGGIVPAAPLARRFRDMAGELHQRLAAVADRVELVVAGLPLRLKG